MFGLDSHITFHLHLCRARTLSFSVASCRCFAFAFHPALSRLFILIYAMGSRHHHNLMVPFTVSPSLEDLIFYRSYTTSSLNSDSEIQVLFHSQRRESGTSSESGGCLDAVAGAIHGSFARFRCGSHNRLYTDSPAALYLTVADVPAAFCQPRI